MGSIIIGDDLELVDNVHVEIDENGKIDHIGKGFLDGAKELRGGIALPPLVNYHAHTADFVSPEYGGDRPIREVVGDPFSIKYKVFKEYNVEKGIYKFLKFSEETGVGAVIDFREEGVDGILKGIGIKGKTTVKHIMLGRTDNRRPSADELKELAELSDGIGVPSANYYEEDTLKTIRSIFNSKLRSVHISETLRQSLRNDLEYVMKNLDPSFIVHGTNLSEKELEELAKSQIPLVMCPRSNLWFSVGVPKVASAIRLGVKLLFGTDNGGIISPNMWREMEVAALIARAQDPSMNDGKAILKAASVNGYGLVRLHPIEEGSLADFMIIDGEFNGISRAINKYMAIVKRTDKILHRVIGEKFLSF